MVRLAVAAGIVGILAPTVRGEDTQPSDGALAVQNAVVAAIAKAERSVVAIARVRKERPPGGEPLPGGFAPRITPRPSGLNGALPTSPDFIPNEYATGVVWDRDGHVVTSYHVLGNPEENDYFVWVRRRPFKVTQVEVPEQVRASDPWTDLAVLKIGAEDLEPITLGDASTLRKGMIVIALGNPYGIARDGDVSAGWGIVSNLRRTAAPDPRADAFDTESLSLHQYGTLIQTDARVTLGTSGGALVNLRGEMVGLTTALAAPGDCDQPGGFAIPVDETFRAVVDTLRQGRRPAFGFLGVQPDHLPLSERQRGLFGVRVLRVVVGTPADLAGLRPDDVITHVNGEIIHDRNALFRELSRRPAETAVELTVERAEALRARRRILKVNVTLSKRYVETAQAAFAQVADPIWRGVRVDYPSALPPQWSAQAIQSLDRRGCVAVAEVRRDSPAWDAGLRVGQCVSHVGERRVTKPAEFFEAVEQATGDVALRMTNPEGDAPVRWVRAPE